MEARRLAEVWALKGHSVGKGSKTRGLDGGPVLTEQDHGASEHNDQCAQADTHTSCSQCSSPRQASAISPTATHSNVQCLLSLLGWLPRVLEQQAQVMQALGDLVSEPQTCMAHCRMHNSQQKLQDNPTLAQRVPESLGANFPTTH